MSKYKENTWETQGHCLGKYRKITVKLEANVVEIYGNRGKKKNEYRGNTLNIKGKYMENTVEIQWKYWGNKGELRGILRNKPGR